MLIMAVNQPPTCHHCSSYLITIDPPPKTFLQLEAIFTVRRINSQRTKFANVVQALLPSIVNKVVNILENVSKNEPCPMLKNEIIKRTRYSDKELLQEIFHHIDINDRTPLCTMLYERPFWSAHNVWVYPMPSLNRQTNDNYDTNPNTHDRQHVFS